MALARKEWACIGLGGGGQCGRGGSNGQDCGGAAEERQNGRRRRCALVSGGAGGAEMDAHFLPVRWARSVQLLGNFPNSWTGQAIPRYIDVNGNGRGKWLASPDHLRLTMASPSPQPASATSPHANSAQRSSSGAGPREPFLQRLARPAGPPVSRPPWADVHRAHAPGWTTRPADEPRSGLRGWQSRDRVQRPPALPPEPASHASHLAARRPSKSRQSFR